MFCVYMLLYADYFLFETTHKCCLILCPVNRSAVHLQLISPVQTSCSACVGEKPKKERVLNATMTTNNDVMIKMKCPFVTSVGHGKTSENLVNVLAHQESLVAQWLERLTGIWEAISLLRRRSFGSSRNGEERLRDEPKERLRRKLGGHGFDSRWGLTCFLCLTLLTNKHFIFIIHLPS